MYLLIFVYINIKIPISVTKVKLRIEEMIVIIKIINFKEQVEIFEDLMMIRKEQTVKFILSTI